MKNNIVIIALGGNALQNAGEEPTIENQIKNIETVIDGIIDLIKEGKKLIITHGNGPQVGRILLQNEIADSKELPASDLDICVAMSQASIGISIEQVLQARLKKEGIKKEVTTLLTEVLVDINDDAFLNPNKPIGQFYDKEEALVLEKSKGYILKKDIEGRYRRVVGSPKPKKIMQLNAIKTLIENDFIVICCGGGGVPVVEIEGKYQGIAGVIDKDNASSLLAQNLNAENLVILTAVPEVCLNYNTPEQKSLNITTISELKENLNQFEPGSMLPKVQSAIEFSENTGNDAIITNLESIKKAITTKKCGTIINR